MEKSNDTLLISYKILGNIPIEKILNHKEELEIKNYELNRTHWALKEVNVVEILKLDYKNA